MSGTLPWYVARASGLVAWGLLAASVVWGLLMTSKLTRGRVKTSWLLDLHRWLGGLALVFTGLHVVAIMSDTYIHFGLASVLIPLAAHWHPVAVAWGVASLYLLVAIELTSLARRHLNQRLWKRVHLLSFPLFVVSTIHGLSAGTDSGTPMAVIMVALGTAAVAALTGSRLRHRADRLVTRQLTTRNRPGGAPPVDLVDQARSKDGRKPSQPIESSGERAVGGPGIELTGPPAVPGGQRPVWPELVSQRF